MLEPKISVVVPIYNSEQYLHCCIDSILSQTFTNFELLLINDGSIDSSGMICEKYAKKDNRVRVFQKENGGVSSARNVGLNNANANYIIFIDSDDWILERMFQDMYEKIVSEDADLVYCDMKNIFKEHTGTLHIAEYDLKKIQMLNNFIRSTFSTVVGMLVKRRLYSSNQIQFPVGIKYCEDFYVAVRLMLYSDKITYLPTTYYCYNRVNESSVTSDFGQKHYDGVQKVYLDTINFFKSEGVYDDYAETLSWRLLKSEQEYVLDRKTYNKFLSIHPDSHKYIWSCPYLNTKIKIMMWSLSHHMRLIAELFLFARKIRLKFQSIIDGD